MAVCMALSFVACESNDVYYDETYQKIKNFDDLYFSDHSIMIEYLEKAAQKVDGKDAEKAIEILEEKYPYSKEFTITMMSEEKDSMLSDQYVYDQFDRIKGQFIVLYHIEDSQTENNE